MDPLFRTPALKECLIPTVDKPTRTFLNNDNQFIWTTEGKMKTLDKKKNFIVLRHSIQKAILKNKILVLNKTKLVQTSELAHANLILIK